MSPKTWVRMGIGLLCLATVLLLYQIIVPRMQPLPVYMTLPKVTLTDQDGHYFDLSQTRGKVVVLSFIYTHCTDVCPLTTAKMKQIQERLQATGFSSQVQLVTFTVDPERDTSQVLKHFSGVFDVNYSNWVFLTGTPDQIQVLIKTLGIYVERIYYIDNTPVPESSLAQLPADASYTVNHTDRLFLVDRQGRVRALQPGSRTNVNEAVSLIRQLVQGN